MIQGRLDVEVKIVGDADGWRVEVLVDGRLYDVLIADTEGEAERMARDLCEMMRASFGGRID